jgi:hypothetical protein
VEDATIAATAGGLCGTEAVLAGPDDADPPRTFECALRAPVPSCFALVVVVSTPDPDVAIDVAVTARAAGLAVAPIDDAAFAGGVANDVRVGLAVTDDHVDPDASAPEATAPPMVAACAAAVDDLVGSLAAPIDVPVEEGVLAGPAVAVVGAVTERADVGRAPGVVEPPSATPAVVAASPIGAVPPEPPPPTAGAPPIGRWVWWRP